MKFALALLLAFVKADGHDDGERKPFEYYVEQFGDAEGNISIDGWERLLKEIWFENPDITEDEIEKLARESMPDQEYYGW